MEMARKQTKTEQIRYRRDIGIKPLKEVPVIIGNNKQLLAANSLVKDVVMVVGEQQSLAIFH